jgi:serine protease AprX
MKRLILRITIAAFALWILAITANAVEIAKIISPDLQTQIKTGDPEQKIEVILQMQPGLRAKLRKLLREHDGEIRKVFKSLNGWTVRLPKKRLKSLALSNGIRYITPDRKIASSNYITRKAVGFDQVRQGYYDKGYGDGVNVAIIDSGINRYIYDLYWGISHNEDFVNRANSGRDDHGHGTHVAGIIAGNGANAYYGDYEECFPEGAAPMSSITNLRVLDAEGSGSVSDVIQAIDWVLDHNDDHPHNKIKVINLSLGHPVFESYTLDPMCQAVERAVLSGIVVVCAAGNFGYSDGRSVYGSIVSPGNHPLAISVGAVNTKGSYARSDDEIAPFSSRGPTLVDGVLKPDIVAPGNHIMSTLDYWSTIAYEHPENFVNPDEFDADARYPAYLWLSGTSMAAPVVSGTVALMLEANPGLTPNLVKIILMYTAQKLVEPDIFTQGAGYLNAEGAVRLASALSQNIENLQPGDSLLVKKEDPYTMIDDEKVVWGSGIFWGDKAVWSDGIFWTDGDVWGNGCLWDQGIFWSDSESWRESLFDNFQSAYGQGIFWGDPGSEWSGGTGPQSTNVVFGNGIFWGDSIVDPNSCSMASTDDVLFVGEGGNVSGLTFVDDTSPYYPVQ